MKKKSKSYKEGAKASYDTKLLYEKEALKYFDISVQAPNEFDKYVFWAAGGAIAFSAAFVTSDKAHWCPALLIVAWVILFAAVALMLRGMVIAADAHNEQYLSNVAYLEGEDWKASGDKACNKRNEITVISNLSYILLILGCALILIYFGICVFL